ncbi:MAG: hypothetical protein K2M87_02140 [Muribaculaceae bacterium]|nr:hypothetical protein [Muribaculaceae bacterium]
MNKRILEGKSQSILNAILLFLIAIGLGVYLMVMPKYQDDWEYGICVSEWLEEHGAVLEDGVVPFTAMPDFSGWIEWMSFEYGHWLPRFANLVSPLLLIWPKWFSSGIMWICWLLACAIMMRRVGVVWRRGYLSVAGAVMITWLIPWQDCMGVLAYQLNYLIPTLLGILLLIYLSPEKRGGLYTAGAFILGFILGGWHEGFGVPVLAGLIAMFIGFRECRRADIVMAGIGVGLGLAFIWFSPGFQTRFGMVSARTQLNFNTILIFCLNSIAYWLGLISLIIALCKRCVRTVFTPDNVFWAFSGMAGCVVCFLYVGDSRVGWWSEFCGIAMMLRSAVLILPQSVKRYSVGSIIIVGSAAVFSITYWTMVDIFTIHFETNYRKAIAEWRKDPTKDVFMEILPESKKPLLIGRMPGSKLLFQFTHIPMRDESYRGKPYMCDELPCYYMYPIPEELKYITSARGTQLRDSYGMRKIGDWFVMEGMPGDYMKPLPADLPSEFYRNERRIRTGVRVDVDFGKGWVPAYALIVGFHSQADGKEYSIVLPFVGFSFQNWYKNHLWHLKRVRVHTSVLKESVLKS